MQSRHEFAGFVAALRRYLLLLRIFSSSKIYRETLAVMAKEDMLIPLRVRPAPHGRYTGAGTSITIGHAARTRYWYAARRTRGWRRGETARILAARQVER